MSSQLPRLWIPRTSMSAASLAGLIFLSGCGGRSEYQEVTSEDVEHAEAHADAHHHHHHVAPHGGHLIELGDHLLNAEVLLEADTGRLVIYLLDAHAENTAPVALEQIEFDVEGGTPIVLAAEPQDNDPPGHSSRFVASGDAVTVDDIEELHGSLTIEVDGQSYTGELSHDHGHDHDGHDHEHHTDHDHE